MGEFFKRWRQILGLLTLAVICVAVWIATTALKVEERLFAVVYTVQLVEEYMKKTEGEWPKSWEALDSTMLEGSFYSSKENRSKLRPFVEIQFDSDLQHVADMSSTDFSLIRPNGPCSNSYRIQIERLISTAKELQANKRALELPQIDPEEIIEPRANEGS